MPMLFDPARQIASANHAGFVVVRAVERGTGMRYVDGNHRDVGIPILGCDYRRNVFVSLKFNREIDLFTDEQIGIPLRRFCAVSIVQGYEFDPFGAGSTLQACRDFLGKLRILPLRRVSQTIQPLLPWPYAGLV